ncbi:MAG: tRNA-dihydrouridine synthase [Clostridiales bacterium]|nr:tRNA-dihydrouridine synthase [Clostridiales bacterium]
MNSVIVGGIKIPGNVALAPMAGVSHIAYRGICREMGAAYAPTELVSARSIRYNGLEKSMQYLRIDPEAEGITAIQLFGAEPDDFTAAIEKIMEDPVLSKVDIIDINMGCPVPKVVKTGAGSALMNSPETAAAIVKTCKKVLEGLPRHIPVTVKTRIGFDAGDKGKPDFAKALADAGCDMLCVHGRTRPQMYTGSCDRKAIALMREAVREYDIPFFANGDVTDGPSAASLMEETGADGVMIGRAARGNPWIFSEVAAYLDGRGDIITPTEQERKQTLLRELEGRCRWCDEEIAVREFRSVMPFYVKGMQGAAKLKVRLCSALTVDEVKEILEL